MTWLLLWKLFDELTDNKNDNNEFEEIVNLHQSEKRRRNDDDDITNYSGKLGYHMNDTLSYLKKKCIKKRAEKGEDVQEKSCQFNT